LYITQIEAALGISPDALFADSPASLKAVGGAREVGGFKLGQRAMHVYQEAARVHQFKAVCDVSAWQGNV
jgi:hypothetical protein